MKRQTNTWSKEYLQVYILLLCANADSNVSEEEINLIKSKTDLAVYDSVYNEFSADNENERLEKIDTDILLWKL